MEINPKHLQAHMEAAHVYAKLSSAVRLKVGALIIKDNRIISIGYNGMPSGWDNTCENTEYVGSNEQIPSPDEMKRLGFTGTDKGWYRLKTKPEVIHAESNAISKLARSTESGDGAIMVCTHAPCLDCAKLIYQSGIKAFYYNKEYRSIEGLSFLRKCNIHVAEV
jgi:dCMP deaminase|tara:strand:- start:56 stop:550 length:495 start_codon:yes stop_codon:yes gene_type:complete